jgi:outer membrane lipoprotein SlyB
MDKLGEHLVALAATALVTLAVVGCGGDDETSAANADDSGSASTAETAQRSQRQDAEAKSAARNLVTQLETCYADEQDYGACDAAATSGNSGLDIGDGKGQVNWAANGASGYTVTATSRSGITFVIERDAATGQLTRSCRTARATASAGCDGGTW